MYNEDLLKLLSSTAKGLIAEGVVFITYVVINTFLERPFVSIDILTSISILAAGANLQYKLSQFKKLMKDKTENNY